MKKPVTKEKYSQSHERGKSQLLITVSHDRPQYQIFISGNYILQN